MPWSHESFHNYFEIPGSADVLELGRYFGSNADSRTVVVGDSDKDIEVSVTNMQCIKFI